jgi:Fe-S oxidoreductase
MYMKLREINSKIRCRIGGNETFTNGLCCGAGGAQMFKDAEATKRLISNERRMH